MLIASPPFWPSALEFKLKASHPSPPAPIINPSLITLIKDPESHPTPVVIEGDPAFLEKILPLLIKIKPSGSVVLPLILNKIDFKLTLYRVDVLIKIELTIDVSPDSSSVTIELPSSVSKNPLPSSFKLVGESESPSVIK